MLRQEGTRSSADQYGKNQRLTSDLSDTAAPRKRCPGYKRHHKSTRTRLPAAVVGFRVDALPPAVRFGLRTGQRELRGSSGQKLGRVRTASARGTLQCSCHATSVCLSTRASA